VFSSNGGLRGYRLGPPDHRSITAAVLSGIPVSHPTWLGRRDWFLRNPYDLTAAACEDQELLLRAHTTSTYANVPDVLLAYREDRIKLRRSMEARVASASYLLRYGRTRRALLPAAVAASSQYVRGARDAVAVLTGRQEWVMRRRVLPARPCDEEVWRGLAPSVSGSAAHR
jgi:hypothetical protein